jgi:hypothetical protein
MIADYESIIAFQLRLFAYGFGTYAHFLELECKCALHVRYIKLTHPGISWFYVIDVLLLVPVSVGLAVLR